MLLQEILFGIWTPPEVSRVITHKIGMSGGSRYVPYAKRVFKTENGLNTSEHLIYEAIKNEDTPFTAPEIAKIVDMSNSHCGMILCALFKKKLLKRSKVRRNGTHMFEYSLKETNAR